ncbi:MULTISPECIES: MFS transporter [Lysobacter]|uniref:MFS transporter n=1 Tax=Lysobacter TaxID=68 RepID=UPI0004CFF9D1|nr:MULTISPECIES: MFS transporter [Lysobacter]
MSLSRSAKNRLALAAVSLAALMFGLEISSVPVILPTLERQLHGDLRDMQWVMNAYTLACTTVLMAAGTLADRYGRRRVFVISVIAFGLTSLLCGLAESMPVLIGGRFLQGLAGGAMLTSQFAILSHQFRDGRERSRAFAVFGIVFGFGLGFGPIIGGAIVALSNWHWVFLVHAPLALLTWSMIAAGAEESREAQSHRLDIGGLSTLSLAVLGLTYYITQAPESGYADPILLGVLAFAASSLIAFAWVEKRHPHPMFDFGVFRIREFSGAIMGSIGMNFSFWPFMIYLPIYFQSALGYDTVTAGLALLAYTLPTLAMPPLAERWSARYRPAWIIPLGLLAIGLGFIAMRYGSAVDGASWMTMLPGALLAGCGLGLTNTPVSNTTTASVPASRTGMASGIDMSARLITLAINIALMGLILVAGIAAHLRSVYGPMLGAALDGAQLRALAGRVAAGDVGALGGLALSGDAQTVAREALVHGFGWVLWYGGIGVCVLAALSLIIFAPMRRAGAQAAQAPACGG